MVGEKPNGYDIPPEILAEGRALSSALSAAGFHPFKSASVVNLADARVAIQNRQQTQEFTGIEDKAELRKKDLRQIHALAEEKGLIVGRDDTEYRIWLTKKFGVKTAALLEDVDRTRVINALRNYKDEFEDLPSDMRDDAKVA